VLLHTVRRGARHHQRVGKLSAAMVAKSLIRLHRGTASIAKHEELLKVENIC
jgi:hypothetical protein